MTASGDSIQTYCDEDSNRIWILKVNSRESAFFSSVAFLFPFFFVVSKKEELYEYKIIWKFGISSNLGKASSSLYQNLSLKIVVSYCFLNVY